MKFPYSFPLTRAFSLYMGKAALLAWETFSSILAGRIRWRLVLNQFVEMGFGSQAVVIITGIFTGAVFTAQIFFQCPEHEHGCGTSCLDRALPGTRPRPYWPDGRGSRWCRHERRDWHDEGD